MSISAPPLTDRSARWHVPVEDKKGLAQLRRDWRMAAMRQWFRGGRFAAILIPAVMVPVLNYYIEHADGKIGWLDEWLPGFAMFIIAPAVAVIFTMLSLDGPRGVARFSDLKTVPGGPTEWARSLVLSARVAAYSMFTIWALADAFMGKEFAPKAMLPMLLSPLLYLWTIPTIVTAVRLSAALPALGTMFIWGTSMWPGYLLYLIAINIPSRGCIHGVFEPTLFALVAGYFAQGVFASRQLSKVYSRISLAAE